jgi:prepilin-type N-terminal cleavage/methylation domain-containing protein
MNRKGVTLIELMICMVVIGVLVAGIYRTFASQQHTYSVQEQVVDMQQNLRMAINQMVRELRMAGFGRPDVKVWGPDGMHGVYKNVVTPQDDGLTIVAGYEQVTTLKKNQKTGDTVIELTDASVFDLDKHQYLCMNGTESHRIKAINGNLITFYSNNGVNQNDGELVEDHKEGEPVFRVLSLTYSIAEMDGKRCLLRDDHLGQGPQPVAENIDALVFRYVMANGDVLDAVPNNRRDEIRMVQVSVTAKTDRSDPELDKVGDGYRRRTVTSNIQLRNLSFQ